MYCQYYLKLLKRSKFFGLYNQIYKNVNSILLKYQTGCQNGYSSKHELIVMFERWRESLDKGGKCGALFIDLSKPFDFLLQKVLLPKL